MNYSIICKEEQMTTKFIEILRKYKNNRKILLLIVYIALFLDNMLLTTVSQFFLILIYLLNYIYFKKNYSKV